MCAVCAHVLMMSTWERPYGLSIASSSIRLASFSVDNSSYTACRILHPRVAHQAEQQAAQQVKQASKRL